jgi:hypothetical protein
MPSLSRRCALLTILAISFPAQAAPPTLTNLTPRGGERGKAVEVIVAGTNLTPQTKLILPFKATQALLPDAKPYPAQVRIQLTVDAGVPLGAYPVRVATEDGVSPFQFFTVDAFPNINEVEDNSSFEKAQKVPVPVIITGQCLGGDVDFFRFTARKGQRLVIETETARLGSGIVPQLRLTDGNKRFLAADDGQRVRGDCRIIFPVPADGEYVIELSDSRYRGVAPPHYRLKIAEYDVIDEVFPLGGRRGETVDFTLRGGTLAGDLKVRRPVADTASPGSMLLALDEGLKLGMLSPHVAVGSLPERTWIKEASHDPKTALDIQTPLTINGRLERKGDIDRFQFAVQPGERYRITVEAQVHGSDLDGVLRVTDPAGKQLALVDDVALPPVAPGQPAINTADPSLDVAVPAGVTKLLVELRDQRHRGGINFGYRLTIAPVQADFTVQQPVAELNVPRGGTAVLSVPVTRRGHLGPIELTIPDLPRGLTVQGGHVPANATLGILTLSAAADTPLPDVPWLLRIEGKATQEGQDIRHIAEQHVYLSRDGNLASSLLSLSQFAVGLTAAEPFAVQGPAGIEVVKGYSVAVPVNLTRTPNGPALAVEATGVVAGSVPAPGQQVAPGALAVKPASITAGATSGTLTITAPINAGEGVLDLVVQGKAKVNNMDRIVNSSAVPVTVHRPFGVEVLTPDVTITSGQTAVLKGRLSRQAVFKEAVSLKLDGLPRGVTLAKPLVPIAAGTSDFEIELKVDPKAAVAVADLTLTCSTSIAGATYAHPPVGVKARVSVAK